MSKPKARACFAVTRHMAALRLAMPPVGMWIVRLNQRARFGVTDPSPKRTGKATGHWQASLLAACGLLVAGFILQHLTVRPVLRGPKDHTAEPRLFTARCDNEILHPTRGLLLDRQLVRQQRVYRAGGAVEIGLRRAH